LVTQFERSHCVVGSQTIILTSWFDERRQVWQTSAPRYMHVSTVATAAHVSSLSRQAGLSHLSRVLIDYFSASGASLSGS
jgi:regulator of sigma D